MKLWLHSAAAASRLAALLVALPAGRIARLGATPDFHHGLLGVAGAFGMLFAVLGGALALCYERCRDVRRWRPRLQARTTQR